MEKFEAMNKHFALKGASYILRKKGGLQRARNKG